MEILEDISYWTATGWSVAVLILLFVISVTLAANWAPGSSRIYASICFLSIICAIAWLAIVIAGWCGTAYYQEQYVIRVNDEITAEGLYKHWDVREKYDYANVFKVYPKEDKK